METTTLKTARILYAIPMAIFGFNHLTSAQAMSGMVPGFIPGGAFWVYLTGIALIAAAASIIINKKARLASYLLAIMLVIFILTIHLPGVFGGQNAQMSIINLLKDFGLASGALLIAGLQEQEQKTQR